MDPDSIPQWMLALPLIKYAVQFPDGEIPGQYIYDSKSELKSFAHESFPEMNITCWKDAKKLGYRIRKVEVKIVEKSEQKH